MHKSSGNNKADKKGKKEETSAIDTMILAFAQLVQPTDAKDLYEAVTGTLVTELLDFDEFNKHFKQIESNGYLWRTGDSRYIVTPKGTQLSLQSLDARKRDKIRLLALNRKRFMK